MKKCKISINNNMKDLEEVEGVILENKYIFKLLLLGEPAVGKTSLILRYVRDTFKSDYQITLGSNFLVKTVDLPNGASVTLQVWDIAGHARNIGYLRTYYAGTSGVLYVYDVTRHQTLDFLPEWHQGVLEQEPNVKFNVIVGNKIDLITPEPVVPEAARDEMANKMESIISFSTSAKTGEGVEEVFNTFAQKLVEHVGEERINSLRS